MGRTYDLSPDPTDRLSRDEAVTEAFSNSTKKVKKVRNRIEASGVLVGMEITNERDPPKKTTFGEVHDRHRIAEAAQGKRLFLLAVGARFWQRFVSAGFC